MRPHNIVRGLSGLLFSTSATATLQNVAHTGEGVRRTFAPPPPPPKHAGGRPSAEAIAITIFKERRRAGVRLPNTRNIEAQAIRDEMLRRGVVRPPSVETIWKYAGVRK